MKYPGKELELFEKAKIWRFYIYWIIKKYIKNKILEVGAGIGSFTVNYRHLSKDITLTELDHYNLKYLNKRFFNRKIKIYRKFTNSFKIKYDTIMYMNVLEHIKNDTKEINNALKILKDNGTLIILVPAHQTLYSKFDREVGHFKRYKFNYFKKLKIKPYKVHKLLYLDSAGYLLYFLNKLFFKHEVYPTRFKIFIWDKFFTPVSFFLDWITNYRFGKNILCIIKKNK